jgi:hypothetical protein
MMRVGNEGYVLHKEEYRVILFYSIFGFGCERLQFPG